MYIIQGFITLTEAERISGIKADTLKKQCQEGKISGAVKQGETWLIPKDSVLNKQGFLEYYHNLDPKDPEERDRIFEIYGPGNYLDVVLQPYERLKTYERMLYEMKTIDANKYKLIHKGTPFYFMSWLAYTIEDYSKAIFYMEAAAIEDIKTYANNNPKSNKWHTTAAGSFLLLDSNLTGPTARHITQEIENEFLIQLDRFNNRTGTSLTKDVFIEKFVKNKIHESEFRSIVSAFYTFLLEYKAKILMIRLKSNPNDGSMEPFFIHLFKGCLVFESLMKSRYLNQSSSNTLGGYLAVANKDLEIGIINSPLYKAKKEWTITDVLNLLPAWNSEEYQEKIIAVTFAIRNTTGHDLGWPNQVDETIYTELFESVIDAIFWYIWKKEI